MNTFAIYAQARVPEEIWILAALMVVLAISTAAWRYRQGKEWVQPMCLILLLTYCTVLVCSTVIFRPESTWYKLMWPPMWSYMKAYGGLTRTALIANGLNVLLFVPIGYLYKFACRYARWWTMLVVTFCLSFSIEVAQYIVPCGFSEVDDLVHNCLGALIGYGIASIISKAIGKWSIAKK